MKTRDTQFTDRNKKIAVSGVSAFLLLLLYLLIFGFSEQDGETSSSFSYYLSEKCAELLRSLTGGSWTDALVENMARYLEHPLRKLAHFGEYACMGTLVALFLAPWMKRGRKFYFLTVCWVFVSAGLDELHQLFVPGRYGSFADVLLDTSGGAFGMAFCLLFLWKKR
ncbi:MAG: VanZ family protein [Clostridium sp.]|jgi:VanZ family protein|nr:VanZ family protein [Clostridium sp.]